MLINIPDLYGTEVPNILALKLRNDSYHVIDLTHLFKDGYWIKDNHEGEAILLSVIQQQIEIDLQYGKVLLVLLTDSTRDWLESRRTRVYTNDNSN
jgi:hypothetical protein